MLRPVPDPPERGPDATSCPLGICEGNGWILQEDNTTIPCDCRERQIGKAISRGMGTGIPKKFRGVSFDRKPIADLDPFVLLIETPGRSPWGCLGPGKPGTA